MRKAIICRIRAITRDKTTGGLEKAFNAKLGQIQATGATEGEAYARLVGHLARTGRVSLVPAKGR